MQIRLCYGVCRHLLAHGPSGRQHALNVWLPVPLCLACQEVQPALDPFAQRRRELMLVTEASVRIPRVQLRVHLYHEYPVSPLCPHEICEKQTPNLRPPLLRLELAGHPIPQPGPPLNDGHARHLQVQPPVLQRRLAQGIDLVQRRRVHRAVIQHEEQRRLVLLGGEQVLGLYPPSQCHGILARLEIKPIPVSPAGPCTRRAYPA